MPIMARLTAPAGGYVPEHPTAVNVEHIVNVRPRYVVYAEDSAKPYHEKRSYIEGTWIETTKPGDEGVFWVKESFEQVCSAIPIDATVTISSSSN